MATDRRAPYTMAGGQLNIVTGATGFSGKYITARLLALGQSVRTLTGHPCRASVFAQQVEIAPLNFARPDELASSMQGAAVLYNTYWVRFPHGKLTHGDAVENSRRLVRAAETAGVKRIVHVSITNPSLQSPLTYFRGKAQVEEIIRSSRLSYAILRPAVLFGDEDILLNNIAWMLRHFPIFAVPGDGSYRVQPIFVDDLAELAVEYGRRDNNVVLDAVGPETYTYLHLVRMLRGIVRSRSPILRMPASAVVFASRLLSLIVGDVVLTKEEVRGLMADLLVSANPPTGKTSLCAWAESHAESLGRKYASELRRHY